jgi:secondary thiamine-phosphate synthase enzyme
MAELYQFSLRTSARCEFVNIDAAVQKAVGASGVSEGVCVVFVPHTTAAVTINENADPDVRRDIIAELEKVIPFADNYQHSEGNAAAHIKASLLGPSVTVIVQGGRLQLGTWQSLFFCEFDGPRTRQVWVKVIPG